MKKLFSLVLLAVFLLSACVNNDSKTNMISTVELTERENVILSITSEKSFVFDFNSDSEYKEVSVWLEKYEFGKLIDDKVSSISTLIEENGTIVFATSKADGRQKQPTFNIGISGNGSMGSVSGFDANATDLDKMASVWGDFQGEHKSIEGELVLASICYSSDESGMSSLPIDFYKDVEGNMSELDEYDVVYLLRAEFE